MLAHGIERCQSNDFSSSVRRRNLSAYAASPRPQPTPVLMAETPQRPPSGSRPASASPRNTPRIAPATPGGRHIPSSVLNDGWIPPTVAPRNAERLQQDPRRGNYLKTKEDHGSRKDVDPMAKLDIVRSTEYASRLVLQSNRRKLQAKKLALTKRQMVEGRLDASLAYKAEQQKEKLALQSVVAASDAEVLKLSELLNRRLVTYEKDASRRSWWKFFMLMDQDKAGVVAYSKFQNLMRIQLEIPERQAPDKLLRSVWKVSTDPDHRPLPRSWPRSWPRPLTLTLTPTPTPAPTLTRRSTTTRRAGSTQPSGARS